MAVRIYADEAGTHGGDWLIIGMLFVPDHGPLHSALCASKENHKYYNAKPRRKARYKETHLAEFRSQRDVDVAREWFDAFAVHNCFYRSLVFDWSTWDAHFFGDPFEPEALKRRRAYKKWAELLLQPEFSTPLEGYAPIRDAKFYLDRLRILYEYDVLDHLADRFSPPASYLGSSRFIASLQHTNSWADANQCLQLCDLLTGCIYQELVPSQNRFKLAARDSLKNRLQQLGVERLDRGYWRQYHPVSLRQKQPKFSCWFWEPEGRRDGGRRTRPPQQPKRRRRR